MAVKSNVLWVFLIVDVRSDILNIPEMKQPRDDHGPHLLSWINFIPSMDK